ncbi:Putative CDP-diacylglycerol--glycerol-3-phosphate 3-phosphatidyl-transferase 2 [uncultured Clostridium sp.]|uniref:CDP-alcohol phosphatidyltransferase family protein n=1 Tax=uncultured Clostridium sp. TaxID=59620 RepID=UPI000822B454|nr:CDP-alcohol phosphatidyltransferase family protein [uncultured Clostridium sp.]SCJ62986.1 Putative CDP-diacylglycerol--glycerol-3-phosphate 3-phosphatidyl-transferase 2 [uncultured Clostridium sp.]
MNNNTEYKKITFKEVYSIPNILCYIRILLIPVFIYVYVNAKDNVDYYMAAAIIFLSGLTDFCDGFIARKFNQVTELGKLIDPVADKLTQAAIIIALMFKIKWMFFLVVLFVIKELSMIINGIILLRKGKKLDGAMWFGKVSTAVFYFSTFIIILFPMLNSLVVNWLMIISAFFMALSFIMYINEYIKMYKKI